MKFATRLGALTAASLVMASTAAVAAPSPSAGRLSLVSSTAVSGPARVGASKGRSSKQAAAAGIVPLVAVGAGIVAVGLAVGGVIADDSSDSASD